MFVSYCERLTKIIVLISAKNQEKFIDFYTNIRYTMFSTFKEGLIMYRKIMGFLEAWKESEHRKPLILQGARQVGKTYLVRDIFAKTYYPDNHIYIDFKIEDSLRDFCSQTANASKIIEQISLLNGKRISKETLLIFDEIQECPTHVRK